MSTGGGKINKEMEQAKLKEQQTYNSLLEKQLKPTPEQERWQKSADVFDNWLKAKDYSKGPEGDILNLDLYGPSHVQKHNERMANLEGIGALGLGGEGDTSTALQLARHRQANEAAENAGASYEQAVGARNAYFEGNALPWASYQTNKIGGMMNTTSQREMAYNQAYLDTRKRSLLPAIFGGALSAGSALLGNPGIFGK